MVATHGMNLAEVRRLGESMQSSSERIDRSILIVDRLVSSTDWVGPEATRFRTQWWPEHRARLIRAQQDLYGLGQSALNNATEQTETSSDDVTAVPGYSTGTAPALTEQRVAELRQEGEGFSNVSDVRSWWDSLSDRDSTGMIESNPEFVGNTDGIPSEDRYAANQQNIQNYLSELRSARDELAAPADNPLEIALNAEIERMERFTRGRNFLIFDAERGLIAEVFGDLSTADDIAIVVPGVGNSFGNYSLDRPSITDAENLYKTARGDTATIQWLGYDTPPGVEIGALTDRSAFGDARATEWAEDLKGFTDGVRETTLGEITISAHSYGTVLATKAADAGMNVDRVILLGSPGVPADDISVFNGAAVYAIENQDDPIAKVGSIVHGTNPTSSDFGATVLRGNDSDPALNPLKDHSTYYSGQSLTSISDAINDPLRTTDGQFVTRVVEPDGTVTVTKMPSY